MTIASGNIDPMLSADLPGPSERSDVTPIQGAVLHGPAPETTAATGQATIEEQIWEAWRALTPPRAGRKELLETLAFLKASRRDVFDQSAWKPAADPSTPAGTDRMAQTRDGEN